MSTEPDWERLGTAVVSRRVELGFKTRTEFGRVLDLSYRALTDLENGNRGFTPGSYATVERALGWAPGSALQILKGGEPRILATGSHTRNLGPAQPKLVPMLIPGLGPQKTLELYEETHPTRDPSDAMHRALWEAAAKARQRSREPLSAQLQRMADTQWVHERIAAFSADDRRSIIEFIDRLGHERFDDWDQRFELGDPADDAGSPEAYAAGAAAVSPVADVAFHPPSDDQLAEFDAREAKRVPGEE